MRLIGAWIVCRTTMAVGGVCECAWFVGGRKKALFGFEDAARLGWFGYLSRGVLWRTLLDCVEFVLFDWRRTLLLERSRRCTRAGACS